MIYRKLKQYAPERLACAYIGIALAFGAAVLSVAGYYFLYRFLDQVIAGEDMRQLFPLALAIVGFFIANTIVYFGSVMATHLLAFRLETNLKKQGLRHLMHASFSFFDRNESGRIRKIIDDNTALTHSSVAHLIPDLTTAVFVPLLGCGLTFYIDWKLGLVFVGSLLTGLVSMQKMMGDRSFMEKYMKAQETMNAGAVEYVRGIQVLKIFRTNVYSLKDFYGSVVEYSKMALKYCMSCRNWYVLFQVFFNSAFLIALFFYYAGDPEPKVFIARFMFYVLFNGVLMAAFMKVMYVGMYVFQANACIGKIETLFDEMQSRGLTHGDTGRMKEHSIEFKEVTFSYDQEAILEKLSFSLEGGKTYALVGSSGSGKTTIAKLISGFYSLDAGTILIGGRDIREYSQKVLAKEIANVFQDVRLFKKTIYENVRLGREDAPREEVMEALHLAQCDEILDKFEKREETMIGSKGVHLSGGEMQRIAIARAILKNAGIVVLDEASAAADPENEYELQRALSNLMRGRTVIMIAHRLSSIRGVDEILVIEDGAVRERGSHRELMGRASRYKELYTQYISANEWRVRR